MPRHQRKAKMEIEGKSLSRIKVTTLKDSILKYSYNFSAKGKEREKYKKNGKEYRISTPVP